MCGIRRPALRGTAVAGGTAAQLERQMRARQQAIDESRTLNKAQVKQGKNESSHVMGIRKRFLVDQDLVTLKPSIP